MAADVDNRAPEDEGGSPPQNRRRSAGSGSWVHRAMWTLLVLGAVPLLALGIKCYQDAQLVKRQVRHPLKHSTRLITSGGLCFNLVNTNETDINVYKGTFSQNISANLLLDMCQSTIN